MVSIDERTACVRSGRLTSKLSVVMWRPNPYHEFLVSCCYARDFGFEIKIVSRR